MRRSTSDRIAPILVLGGAMAAFPTAAGHFFARDKVAFGGELHFIGVGLTALAATAAAIALTIIGARRSDGRTVVIGTAFSVMAALLALHGITTPDVLMGYNSVVSFTGGATLPIGGAIFALAALPEFRRPRVGLLLVAQALLLTAVLGLAWSRSPPLSSFQPCPRPEARRQSLSWPSASPSTARSGGGRSAGTCSHIAMPTCSSSSGSRRWEPRFRRRCCCATTSSAGGSDTASS